MTRSRLKQQVSVCAIHWLTDLEQSARRRCPSTFLLSQVTDEVLDLLDVLFQTIKLRKSLDRQVYAVEE
jgi:hypothetical protein